MIYIVARQLFIEIIIGCSTIVAKIVHGNKSKKIDARILAVMLKIMRYKLRNSQQLPQFGITQKMDNDKKYDKIFPH